MVWARGRGGQPDEEGVEVFQHLPPDVVDRAVAFVDDDEIERLDGHLRVVDDRHRLLDQRRAASNSEALFVLFRELLLALEDRVEPLDRRDADLGGRVDRVAAEVLDGVFLGELVVVVRADVLLELVEGLLAQVVAVHQEQNPLGLAELDEPIAGRAGGEGLARARGHLDHGPRAIVGQRLFQVADRLDLDVPEAVGDQFRHLPQIGPELAIERGQPDQFFRSMEGEDLSAAGIGIEKVGETGCRLPVDS